MEKFFKSKTGNYIVNTGSDNLHIGVVGREINSVNYQLPTNRIREEEKKILTAITGVEPEKIIMLNQVHGDRLIDVAHNPIEDLPCIGDGDGLLTGLRGILLVIRTADCVPLFLYDEKQKKLGAVHSGWKGSALNIAGKCVMEMIDKYASDPLDIKAFILPSIGPESYEVNEDVAVHFPANRIVRAGKLYVDLWGAVEDSLKKAGIKHENIYNTNICNRINHRDFFSHRFGDEGRNLNFAFMGR
ncbi:MAG: polyphenol oxidase family protein [Spirochaetes bacterium]|nr:polyphenol oxidase family protein [Spirochaetota bacterium]